MNIIEAEDGRKIRLAWTDFLVRYLETTGMAEVSVSTAAVNLGDGWSYTDFPVLRVSHRWTINRFRTLCKNVVYDRKLESAAFACGSTEWHLELNLEKQKFSAAEVRFSLVLDKAAENHDRMVEYTWSIISQNPKFECKKTASHSFNTAPRKSAVHLISLYDLLNARAKDLLVNDTLTILCELTLSFISDRRTVSLPGAIEDSLTSDLGALLEDKQLSDITLVVGGKEFPAHRNILSARSPVFKAMFQHNMREKIESRLDISDLSADTVQGMLQWIYTGWLPGGDQESKDLFCASERYNLGPLKVSCERLLCQSLSVSNAVDLFELADLHSADCLKSYCIRFITAHVEMIKVTDKWKQFEKERIDLLLELARHLLNYRF